MSTEETQAENGGIEAIFGVLEEKIEKLSARVKEMTGENARLKQTLAETEKERDTVKAELAEAKDAAGKTASELSEKLARFEADRGKLRERIERLVQSLEEPAPPASE